MATRVAFEPDSMTSETQGVRLYDLVSFHFLTSWPEQRRDVSLTRNRGEAMSTAEPSSILHATRCESDICSIDAMMARV